MFGESRLITSYFQQMTLRSKIPKIIHNTRFFGAEWIILGWSIDYFNHFGGGVFFLKIRCDECNFAINSSCPCNLSKFKKVFLISKGIKRLNVHMISHESLYLLVSAKWKVEYETCRTCTSCWFSV